MASFLCFLALSHSESEHSVSSISSSAAISSSVKSIFLVHKLVAKADLEHCLDILLNVYRWPPLLRLLALAHWISPGKSDEYTSTSTLSTLFMLFCRDSPQPKTCSSCRIRSLWFKYDLSSRKWLRKQPSLKKILHDIIEHTGKWVYSTL